MIAQTRKSSRKWRKLSRTTGGIKGYNRTIKPENTPEDLRLILIIMLSNFTTLTEIVKCKVTLCIYTIKYGYACVQVCIYVCPHIYPSRVLKVPTYQCFSLPVFSSSNCSFCSTSARTFSLFSNFCKRLPTSTIAPLYTIRPTFSSTSFDSCFTTGVGSNNLFPVI